MINLLGFEWMNLRCNAPRLRAHSPRCHRLQFLSSILAVNPFRHQRIDIELDGCWISVSLRYWRKRVSVLRHSVAMASDIKEGCPCTSVSPPDVGHIKNNGIIPKIHWQVHNAHKTTSGLIAKRKRECGICGTTLRHRSNWKLCITISFRRGCVDFVYGPGTHAVAIKYIYYMLYINSYSAFSMQFTLTLLPAFLLKTLQNINHISSCCLNSSGKNSLMGVVVFFFIYVCSFVRNSINQSVCLYF